ncbi:lipopolysaccharide biosynthesis protein [Vaginisenegalia massiliensis]|uniref:lipopolysaccharide biosynthesis protein n=1 Tax=Vaginisenegalia massiliensis TaxID=2058294 RepID=UPI000F5484DC|nr:oligosaccharide flippase family protein [Vaginisenegalia massiliensis]
MKQFLKRLAGFSYGPILGALISFMQIPLLTHFLSVQDYGKAGLFRTLIFQLPNFIYIGLDQAFTREYHVEKDKRNLMQQALIIPLIVGVTIFAVCVFFAKPISAWMFYDAQYYFIVWYGGIWVLSTIVERFFLLMIRMEEKAKEFSNYSLLLKINVFLLTLVLIAIGMRDFRTNVYSLIFGQLLGDLVLYYKYRHLFDLSQFEFDPVLVKRMFKFGLPIMIAVSLSTSLNLVDNLFLRNYSSKEELGIYNGVLSVVNIIGIIKTAFASFWVPTAYRWYDEKKSMKHYKFISDAVLFILTFIFFAIVVGKPIIVMILGAKKYADAQYIIALLCFPHIMYTLSETTTLGIVFSRKTQLNILVSLATFIPSVVINFLLTPSWGYRGAAVASCAANIMFYLARTYFSSRTGFYFSQKKHILSILMMTLVATLNAFPIPYIWAWSFLLGLVVLFIQFGTIQDGISIKRQAHEWDFS